MRGKVRKIKGLCMAHIKPVAFNVHLLPFTLKNCIRVKSGVKIEDEISFIVERKINLNSDANTGKSLILFYK